MRSDIPSGSGIRERDVWWVAVTTLVFLIGVAIGVGLERYGS